MEFKENTNGLSQPKGLFIKDRKQDQIELKFSDLYYTVSLGINKGYKDVLKNISGKFAPSQLIAIMGPSGAGKSSLLDVISGYNLTGVRGNIIVNNRERLLNEFRRVSCYIQQDDRLQPLLTVNENMQIAANLKLTQDKSPKYKEAVINEILSTLGLEQCKATRTSRLSGGQKKRLSIALELINNPMIMFLDEPTTGLDSSSCSQCIKLLRLLAHQGRTIICTIHQPSATLFQMFDQVYVLANGNCLYQGSTDNLVPYLSKLELPCPKYHNPADYVIELACGEHGEDKIDKMVKYIENGRSLTWSKFNDLPEPVIEDIEIPKNGVYNSTTQKQPKQHIFHETSSYNQLKCLLHRGAIKCVRDPDLTYLRLGVNLVISLLLGTLFHNTGVDGSTIFDNYNLLFSIIMHHVGSTLMLNIINFPSEISIVTKEHFNRWYSLKVYYIATNILDIPITTLGCLIFSVIIYTMTGQPMNWYRFSMFTFTCWLIVLTAQSLGFIVGVWFNVVNGNFVGPIIVVVLMMFSGFGVNVRDIPDYLKWGTYISFLRYALEAIVSTIYNGRDILTCNTLYCHYKYSTKFLKEVAMPVDQFGKDIIALLINLVIFRLAAYYLLRLRIRTRVSL
ncbi:ATP-binding cassette sub-family G member 4 [Daktulosphaira vitifoliae]|uniref:ATP-binding cassette sub-family G member 4 n=1 Tax=Daktulosphaira vitifoliae TaxID=58002 RepID=UPI0021AA0D19|nr:ATP-binding cassette sub-family G member 4 [Daktulosphaira vitifoliae]XP_050548542.1 ATP-binding cassette sub-family G member 4 [Daktulosphaira vitifoliae]XP_050548543.1 ATP-binding cassette sub-family G member 4 [Daktulosphaira vitifoliae]XP_050548544.1 ATP-binding cassette sub-family G member 4 [Daktulosphaira vitifoliae]XP_050548545.1 ATP-binding cassette sub-family G member 4 [Daktulosphaira vitifoliae]XP_050548546.1 ATP-binding cassette sub-family G member 4 [Daktulosphaira vitifoliae]